MPPTETAEAIEFTPTAVLWLALAVFFQPRAVENLPLAMLTPPTAVLLLPFADGGITDRDRRDF